MLLQRVWQIAYNRFFRVLQIIGNIYFHAYIRIRVGKNRVKEGFSVICIFICGLFNDDVSRLVSDVVISRPKES
jgi:hypothetical protein